MQVVYERVLRVGDVNGIHHTGVICLMSLYSTISQK